MKNTPPAPQLPAHRHHPAISHHTQRSCDDKVPKVLPRGVWDHYNKVTIRGQLSKEAPRKSSQPCGTHAQRASVTSPQQRGSCNSYSSQRKASKLQYSNLQKMVWNANPTTWGPADHTETKRIGADTYIGQDSATKKATSPDRLTQSENNTTYPTPTTSLKRSTT